ncbi:hypothetical protein QBC34DRAFT_442936 [Podospora aff. communis PSN243]|uniref:Apple domain-containing protein n=1 Tax=Podospora aff. communis PSN243 TaxID=3040156 RepID=A0AAV9G986_9PEZI|nr:hypothetical protein QBC34DRAFT_442936 [Podospora aff. communis PSN243]
MIQSPPSDGRDTADTERRPGSSPQDLPGSAIEGHQVASPDQPQYQELLDNPGLEVVQPSTLEVAPPKPRPINTPPAGWEKKGSIPDDGPYHFDPQPPYAVIAPPTYIPPTSHDNSPLIPCPPALPVEQRDQRKIIGVKQTTFYILLAIGILFGVAAIAVGVGVGIFLQKESSSPETTGQPSDTTTTTTTTTSIPPRPPNLPLPTATSSTSPSITITCPTSNLTLYTSSSTPSRPYLLVCGRDYHSAHGAVDLFNIETPTMNECIDLCARTDGCEGAGWGDYRGRHVCWLKRLLGSPQRSQEWYFAVLDQSGERG